MTDCNHHRQNDKHGRRMPCATPGCAAGPGAVRIWRMLDPMPPAVWREDGDHVPLAQNFTTTDYERIEARDGEGGTCFVWGPFGEAARLLEGQARRDGPREEQWARRVPLKQLPPGDS